MRESMVVIKIYLLVMFLISLTLVYMSYKNSYHDMVLFFIAIGILNLLALYFIMIDNQ